eukprot:13071802-Alexandrium_andersonii.AAC.1
MVDRVKMRHIGGPDEVAQGFVFPFRVQAQLAPACAAEQGDPVRRCLPQLPGQPLRLPSVSARASLCWMLRRPPALEAPRPRTPVLDPRG